MKRVSRKKMQDKIIKAVKRSGRKGATVDELSDKTGIDRQTLSPRLAEIAAERYAITTRLSGTLGSSGRLQTVSRKSKSGRAQQVWFYIP